MTITRARSEFKVSRQLQELDVTHRCYQVRRIEAHQGHKMERLYPAFTGYVFTYANDIWYHLIRDIDGVYNFLSMEPEGYPTPIPDREIERLDSLADTNLVFGTYDPLTPEYRVGDPIRILSGPFYGFVGIFLKSLSFAVLIEVDIFGRRVPTTVAWHQIEKLAHDTKKARRCKRGRKNILSDAPVSLA